MAGSLKGMFTLSKTPEEIQEAERQRSTGSPYLTMLADKTELNSVPCVVVSRIPGGSPISKREPYPGVFVLLDRNGDVVAVRVEARRNIGADENDLFT